jgi:predicted nucleic acid-binding protein
MSSHLTVVYDACVLYPAPLRDLLLRLALKDRFRARWSNAIHDEWIHNLLKQRPELDRTTLEKTRALMDSNVRDSLVEDFEHLVPTIELPDLGDRHVVAAAIHSSADIIVTFNLKDFPTSALDRYNLGTQHPDDFIVDLFDLHPTSVLQALAEQRASLKKPPKTADEFLDILFRQGLTQTVSILKDWKIAL